MFSSTKQTIGTLKLELFNWTDFVGQVYENTITFLRQYWVLREVFYITVLEMCPDYSD